MMHTIETLELLSGKSFNLALIHEDPLIWIKKLHTTLLSHCETSGETLEKVNRIASSFITAYQETLPFVEQCLHEHEAALTRMTDHFKSKPAVGYGLSYLFKPDSFSVFEKTLTAYQQCWRNIKPHLQEIFDHFELKKHPAHSISKSLNPDNNYFLTQIEDGYLSLHEEIGLIALQRLKDIAISGLPTEKGRAKILIYNYIGLLKFTGDSPFAFNQEELKIEILKLAMHAKLHPDKKIAWIGTARHVEAMIALHEETAAYFNPKPDCYSWELNRAWLQAATKLDYSFQLLEDPSISMFRTIASGDTTKLVFQLAHETRGIDQYSQYSRGDSPTASYQETLLLLEMGYKGVLQPDGSLILSQDKRPKMTIEPYFKKSVFMG